jgi:hypothetical protein
METSRNEFCTSVQVSDDDARVRAYPRKSMKKNLESTLKKVSLTALFSIQHRPNICSAFKVVSQVVAGKAPGVARVY